jgi:Glycosyltransferase family 9 (heptosyltransferase)
MAGFIGAADKNERSAIDPQPRSRLGLSGRVPKSSMQSRSRILPAPKFSSDTINNPMVAARTYSNHDLIITKCRSDLERDPSNLAALIDITNSLVHLCRYEETIEVYERASAAGIHHPFITASTGKALLGLGDYVRGWPLYDAHREIIPQRNYDVAVWRGEPLGGKTILIHGEQGFGDTIQFLRYVPLIADLGAKVVLEVYRELVTLAKWSFGNATIITRGEAFDSLDFHCPSFSLPVAFGTTLDTIPQRAFLSAPSSRIERWRNSLPPSPRIGLAWSTNPANYDSLARSIPTSALKRLLSLRGAVFVSVQREVPSMSDLTELPALFPLGSTFVDFADVAAVISQLDLVITADTAIAHVAGAMGKPVWVLLPFHSDWKWMRGRDSSPWYASARLFRQPAPWDWESTMNHVRKALKSFIAMQ